MQAYLGSLWAKTVALLLEAPPAALDSTATEAPVSQPLPSLPSELVLRILHFTLEPPTYEAHAARARRLCQYALLSRDCARWATLELRRDVRLETFARARWFAQDVLGQHGRGWGDAVRVLRLGIVGTSDARGDLVWRGAAAGTVVRDLLRQCTCVEELWVSGIGALEVADIAPGGNIQRLYINESRISTGPDASTALHLPRVTHLYLKAVIFTGHAFARLLDPRALPSLQHVEYYSVHQSLVSAGLAPMPPLHAAAVPGGASNLAAITANLAALNPRSTQRSGSQPPEHPLLPFAPQLVTLALGWQSTRSLPLRALIELLAHASSLEGLSLSAATFSADGVADALVVIPTLRAIRITHRVYPAPSESVSEQGRADWRDPAFDLAVQRRPSAGANGEAPVAAPGQQPLSRRDLHELLLVQEAFPVTLDALTRFGPLGRGVERVLTVPSTWASDGETFATTTDMRSLGVLVEGHPVEEMDGAWLVGAQRWRVRTGLQ